MRVPRDTFLEITPELVVEVAASSAAYDLHDKQNVYRRNGVQEYLVLVVYEKETRWYTWTALIWTENALASGPIVCREVPVTFTA